MEQKEITEVCLIHKHTTLPVLDPAGEFWGTDLHTGCQHVLEHHPHSKCGTLLWRAAHPHHSRPHRDRPANIHVSVALG
jgi:hypothetical protein